MNHGEITITIEEEDLVILIEAVHQFIDNPENDSFEVMRAEELLYLLGD